MTAQPSILPVMSELIWPPPPSCSSGESGLPSSLRDSTGLTSLRSQWKASSGHHPEKHDLPGRGAVPGDFYEVALLGAYFNDSRVIRRNLGETRRRRAEFGQYLFYLVLLHYLVLGDQKMLSNPVKRQKRHQSCYKAAFREARLTRG